MTHIIVDANNQFFRAFNILQNSNDIDMKIGYSFHILLYSMRKVWKLFDGKHVVLCLDGGSWRKNYDSKYKLNRVEAREALTDKEKEENEIIQEALNGFVKFLQDKTNVTVLHSWGLEADDLIAFWIEAHKDDKHVIISTDSDFKQLVSENVSLFAGVDKKLYLTPQNAVVNKISNKDKEVQVEILEDPEFCLFEKCIRGDKTDNIFSAYPKVRKTKILEAYQDRHTKGYAWNNFMMKKWVDHNEEEHTVGDKYLANKLLIDLSMQPEDVKIKGMETILEATSKEPAKQVGIHFLKFCALHGLNKIAEIPNDFIHMFNAKYL